MKNPMTPMISGVRGFFSLLVIVSLVGGCTRQQGLFPNYQDDDMRERHLMKSKPIQQSLTITPIGPAQDRISPADADRINRFVDQFKLASLSQLTIDYAGSGNARTAVNALVKDLDSSQITTRSETMKSGVVQIVFSYTAVQTVLDKSCDGIRTDGGNTLFVPNKTIGCAYSKAFAQQVNDPRDLIDPRPIEKKYYSSTNNPNGSKSETEDASTTTPNKISDAIKSIIN